MYPDQDNSELQTTNSGGGLLDGLGSLGSAAAQWYQTLHPHAAASGATGAAGTAARPAGSMNVWLIGGLAVAVVLGVLGVLLTVWQMRKKGKG